MQFGHPALLDQSQYGQKIVRRRLLHVAPHQFHGIEPGFLPGRNVAAPALLDRVGQLLYRGERGFRGRRYEALQPFCQVWRNDGRCLGVPVRRIQEEVYRRRLTGWASSATRRQLAVLGIELLRIELAIESVQGLAYRELLVLVQLPPQSPQRFSPKAAVDRLGDLRLARRAGLGDRQDELHALQVLGAHQLQRFQDRGRREIISVRHRDGRCSVLGQRAGYQ